VGGKLPRVQGRRGPTEAHSLGMYNIKIDLSVNFNYINLFIYVFIVFFI
jgi:hypothetical protein